MLRGEKMPSPPLHSTARGQIVMALEKARAFELQYRVEVGTARSAWYRERPIR